MTDQEIETMVNKIGEVAPDQVATFLRNPDAFDYSVLEGYSDFTDKYKNVAEFVGDKNAIKANIWKDLNGVFPSDARFQSLQNKYPWLNKEDLKSWFDKTNKYKELYEKERAKEAAKIEREREVKDWGWRNIIASDYEKQRYINEPEKSLFGKQSPELGKAPETRYAAIADLGTGTAATTADFIPPAWLLGPVLRTGRDLGYKLSGSNYAKDWSDIWTSSATDVALNAGARYLLNARKGQRIANEMTNPEVARTLGVDATTEAINESLGKVNSLTMQSLNDKELINLIKDLPESPMKADLINAIKTSEENLGRPLNRKAIGDVVVKYQVETSPAIQESARGIREGNVVVIGDQGPFGKNASTYLKDVAQATPYEDLTKGQKASYLYNKLVGKINSGSLGQRGVQGMADLKGRGIGNPNVIESESQKKEKDDSINRIINNYSLLWNKKSPPPEAKDSPLIKAAWERWSKQ